MKPFLSHHIKIGDPVNAELVDKMVRALKLLDFIFDELPRTSSKVDGVFIEGWIPPELIKPFLET